MEAIHPTPVALIVDDEKSICETLAGVLSDEGWRPVMAHSGRDGMSKFIDDPPDIVFLDVWMPGMDGIETLQNLRELRNDIPVVVMSGHGNIETAVKATKLGAFDFLEKPLSLEKILPMMTHAREVQRGRDDGEQRPNDRPLIGQSEPIEMIRQQIRIVAPRNSWVLITGENGTGKEVVARHIHSLSSREKRPFVEVNCAAIPEELIESELFGHVKGAFTGAISHKKGRFEAAHLGTLFLDEIGDMSLKTQAKILRILQEQKFEPVGGTETISVDVRVVAATNKDMEAEIKAGQFREDLFYRLNVIPFHVPPLRERSEDIVLLTEHFLAKMAEDLQETPKRFTASALECLCQYSWPGNVRELKNIVERLSVMVQTADIDVEHLPPTIRGQFAEELLVAKGAKSLKEARNEFERSFILDRLQENQWNISKTAEAIGIERSNLHRKLRAYQIESKRLKG